MGIKMKKFFVYFSGVNDFLKVWTGTIMKYGQKTSHNQGGHSSMGETSVRKIRQAVLFNVSCIFSVYKLE